MYHHDNFKVVSFCFLLKELIQTSAIYSTELFTVARGVASARFPDLAEYCAG